MSPKRLLCAAVWSLCFAGAAAFAQNAAPSAQPADQPGAAAMSPAAPSTPPAPSASNAKPAAPIDGPVRNIVLVHGAFVDGSSWNGVVVRLQQKGYHVSSVQNPLTSLADDVAATRRVLVRQDGPTMLVGHSWGGVVITEVGANAPNVAGLVYVAAIAPDLHESIADLMKHGAQMPAMQAINADANGFLWLDRSRYHADLAADVPENLTRVLCVAQVPISSKAFSETVSQVQNSVSPYALTFARLIALMPTKHTSADTQVGTPGHQ